MITPEEFLVDARLLVSTDLEQRFNFNFTRDGYITSTKKLVEVMKEYAEYYHQEKIKESIKQDE